MQVRIEEISPVEKKLIVEVPWETVSVKLGDAYRELGKGVALKGFRKGKVPRPVLEKMFGARVKSEVAYELVRESFVTATQQHSLDAVSEPHVDGAPNITKGEPFTFQATVEVRGEIANVDYVGMALNKRPLAVAEESVDTSIEALRKEHTELVPIEGRTETGAADVVSIKIDGSLGEHQISRPEMTVDLEDESRDPLPGLIAALRGLPISATDHALEIKIPEDHEEKEIAGKTANLVISILDARTKVVPEIDDDFAKDTGKGETVAELRAGVRKDLEDAKTDQIKRELRDAAQKELVKRNQIPVAKALIDRAVDYQYRRLQMMMGIPANQTSRGPSPDLREKMRPSAADEVRGQLLLDAVAKAENLEVSAVELDAHLADVAKTRNTGVARLKAEYDRDGRLDDIKFQLLQDKALDLLVSKATVTEKEPEPAVEGATDPDSEVIEAALKDISTGGGGHDHDHDHGHHHHVHGPDCDHDH